MFHLSHGDLLKPVNSRGNPNYRLPLNHTNLENYTNTSYSKDSPYATRNDVSLSSDKPKRDRIMGNEKSKENNSKGNIHVNAILNSNGNSIFYEKKSDKVLHKQTLESNVSPARSNMPPELYQTIFNPNIAKQDQCTALRLGLLNPGSKSRRGLVLNQPLADEHSKLDLSILPKRKNTLVAPFCNEVNFDEEDDDYSMSAILLTEDIKPTDKNNRVASSSQVPVLRKLLNGLKYYFQKHEAKQRCRD